MSLRSRGSILLISCYELGHQPLGVALPLGFLQRAGFSPDATDVAIEPLDDDKIARAKFVGICVPMHTALRLGVRVAERVREVNAECHICFYGLYASLNSEYLLSHGADSCIGGEYEEPLLNLIESLDVAGTLRVPSADFTTADGKTADGTRSVPVTVGVGQRGAPALPYLERLPFAVPYRETLPPLEKYAQLDDNGQTRTAGYVEASRGCLHLCTHCPIPPVYGGRFFILPPEVVLEDIRRQVAAGATHITFGDPDFLNGPKHSLRVVRAMHEEFPQLTFDFTAKVEHLLHRGEDLPEFGAMGCLFLITAVESLSDRVLTILDKQHTRADVAAALARCRAAGIAMRPTWVAFTPWTTLADYLEVLHFIDESDLVDHVDPVQYAIRLLIPPGSWLADHAETLPHRGPLDEAAFTYRWTHPDPRMDELQKEVTRVVEAAARAGEDPAVTFDRILDLAEGNKLTVARRAYRSDRRRAPRLTESWFC